MEDFDKNKIISGIEKAGGTKQEGEKIAQLIELWLPSAATDFIVDHARIKMKVLELLKKSDPKVYSSFESYKK